MYTYVSITLIQRLVYLSLKRRGLRGVHILLEKQIEMRSIYVISFFV